MTGAEVVVAGAGIAGSALAFELSRRGVATVLLERGAAGPEGASTVPAALINPHRGRSGRAKPNDVAGATAFWELVADLEATVGATGAYRTGVLRLADNARQARVWQKLEGTLWLEPGEVPPEYHAPFGGMLVPSGGWLRSEELLTALAAGTRAGAGRVLTGVELVGVELGNVERSNVERSNVERGSVELGSVGLGAVVQRGGSAGVRAGAQVAVVRGAHAGTETSRIACRAIVVATGAWQPPELRLPRLELVWGEARMLDLGFTPSLPLAGGVVAAFQNGLATVTGGHRHVGWLGHPAEPRASNEQAPDLRRALAWHVPAAAGASVIGSWEGVRAKRPSGEPVVRRIAPGVYLMGAFGGRGFLRAASAAARLADELAARLR